VIGILGGTFDPIHFGHLRPALDIVESLDLEELRIIPSANPPHRWQPQATAEHRLNMVQLAIEDIHPFVLDDREYHRNGASYSIDTVESIREEIGKKPLCLVLGLDAFQSFTSWKNWQKILHNCHLVVSTRPGYEMNHEQHEWVDERLVDDPVILKNQSAGNIYFCDVTQLDISATMIRDRLSAGKSCHFLMPKKVCDYINEHKLYR